MNKYFVFACVCLTVALVQAQEQETTTDKRVERDVGMPDMQQIPGNAGGVMSDMIHTFSEGVQGAMNAMKDMIPKADSFQSGIARRRRAAQQNSQPPKQPQPPKA